MEIFRQFEIRALALLCTELLGEELLNLAVNKAEFVRLDHTGSGYFLTVRSHLLHGHQLTFSKPMVLGSSGQFNGSFLAFVGENELMLEFAGADHIPLNFRDLPVHVWVQEDEA